MIRHGERGKNKSCPGQSSEKRKADERTLRNSEYWKQFYLKSIELRTDLDNFLWSANEMIKVSMIFEEGKISKQQFEDKQRELTDLLAREEKRRNEALLRAQGRATYGYQEGERFLLYRGSLFLDYDAILRRQLDAAGPQFSISNCTFFGDSIQCAAQNPPF